MPVSESDNLIPVAVAVLRSMPEARLDLFISQADATTVRLYCTRERPVDPAALDLLAARGVDVLYTSSWEDGEYQLYLSAVLADELRPPAQRLSILRDAAKALFRCAVQTRATDRIVCAARDIGRQIIDLIDRQDVLVQDVLALLVHDHATYTHAVNVCASGVVLAKALGISDRTQLDEIAKGAMLHDIGKQYLAANILRKAGAYDDGERAEMQQHPQRGFELLCHRPDMSLGSLLMVYQHHERLNGAGYPVGLVEDEIHPWARLCAVVDVHDALRADRPYRVATPPEAMATHLKRESGSSLDSEMVACWLSVLNKPN